MLRLSLHLQRFRLIAYAVLTAAFTAMATLPAALSDVNGHWRIVRAPADKVAQYWQTGVENATFTLILVLVFCAADLGATAMGDDAAQRTLEFLLTRPRPRSRLMWTAWIAAVAHAVILAVLGVATCAAILLGVTGALEVRRVLSLLGVLLLCSLAMLSLAFCLSVGTGSARNGYLLAALALAAYTLLSYASLGRRFSYYRLSLTSVFSTDHPAWHALALLLLALLLPLIAAAAFVRREI